MPRKLQSIANWLAVILMASDQGIALADTPAGSAGGGENSPHVSSPEVRKPIILYPFDETVFPPEIAPPTFRWQETGTASDSWRLRFNFPDGLPPVEAMACESHWCPDPKTWVTIKQRSRSKPAQLLIEGFRGSAPDRPLSRGRISFSTSPDEVGAPIFYRDVNLPFIEAVKDPSDIRWRFGEVSLTNPPPVLLDRFTATNRTANIPEFVNLPARGLVKIQEQFLNDYSFERAGNEFYRRRHRPRHREIPRSAEVESRQRHRPPAAGFLAL